MDSPQAAEPPGEDASLALIASLDEARRNFLALVADLRPELHRYCTRMTGSVADGEDVVQDALARAYYELSALKSMPPLRPWLFRIAHNRAIDHWRHERHRAVEPLEAAFDIADSQAEQPDGVLARQQAVQAALACFIELAPAQRGCVILKDVLEHSLDEIAEELEMSLPAVKAALHRGRSRLRALTQAAPPAAPAPRAASPELLNYARLFNARDWDALRALLADDVRLELVGRHRSAGRMAVGNYFSNYQRLEGWHLEPAWLEGREVLLARRQPGAAQPTYFVELQWQDGRIAAIRDFHFVPYIAQEARFDPAAGLSAGATP